MIEAAGQRFLIDCGMEQGKDVYENQPIPVASGEIDWVLATHAHIDHTGMLPLLVRNGFRGKIYATNPTVELCGIMLRDSAHIQEFEAEWKNRKGQRSGAEPVEPMYTVQAVSYTHLRYPVRWSCCPKNYRKKMQPNG